MKPEITVIIPTYNRPVSLAKVIKSIENQTYKPYEIIVVDDGSLVPVTTNHTLIRNTNNLGEAQSVNLGFAKVNSQFFAVVSDDDPQPRNWLEAIAEEISKNENRYLVYYPRTFAIDRDHSKEIETQSFDKNAFWKFLKLQIFAGAVIDKEFLVRHKFQCLRLPGKYPSDTIQWLRLSLIGDFFFCKSAIAHWHIHDDQNIHKFRNEIGMLEFQNSLIKWQEIEEIPDTFLAACILRIFQLGKTKPYLCIKIFLKLTTGIENKPFTRLIIVYKLLSNLNYAFIYKLRNLNR